MEHKKPISFTRKAIQGAAEQLAANESAESPQNSHFEEAFKIFRNIKAQNPDIFHTIMETTATAHELKKVLGPDAFLVFSNVSREITEEIIADAESQHEMTGEKHEDFLKKLFDTLENRIRSDSRIASAFNSEEALLDKAIDYLKTELVLILRKSHKS